MRNRRPLFFEVAPKVPMDVSLGTPGVGIHSHRFLGMAYGDFLGTFALAAGCAIFESRKSYRMVGDLAHNRRARACVLWNSNGNF